MPKHRLTEDYGDGKVRYFDFLGRLLQGSWHSPEFRVIASAGQRLDVGEVWGG